MANIHCVLTSKVNGTVLKAVDVPDGMNIPKVWAAHTKSPGVATLTVNGVEVDYMDEFLGVLNAARRGWICLDRQAMQSA